MQLCQSCQYLVEVKVSPTPGAEGERLVLHFCREVPNVAHIMDRIVECSAYSSLRPELQGRPL
jgi:hypothetical protein